MRGRNVHAHGQLAVCCSPLAAGITAGSFSPPPEGKRERLIVAEGGKSLRAALPVVYPRIPLQLNWAHKMRRIAGKVSRKEGSCVAEASDIYRAGSQAEALRAFRPGSKPGNMVARAP